VPLIVRGPGVPAGKTLPHLVLNNDLAPTFADLAGATEATPPFVDVRSLRPLLMDDPPSAEDWRSAFLVEAATELDPTAVPPLSGDRLPEDWRQAPREDWGRPGLEAVRTDDDHLYVEYGTGERELYDLKGDPYQLDNRYDDADPELLGHLRRRLAALRDCSGPECHAAEDSP
jgi:N-acetylglucosamine-6-sulfatase